MRQQALSLTRALSLSLVFGLLLPSFASAAAGQTDGDGMLSPHSLSSPTGGADGQSELQSMLERARRMKGYSYESTLTTYKGGGTLVETGKLYFKSPNMLRFEVIKSPSHSGAVVVHQADGKIRGQMGGMLSGIKVTLSPDSKLLRTGNGFSLLQSDLESLLEIAENKLKGDTKCLAVGPAAGHSKVVEIVKGDGDVVDRIAEDGRAKLPEEWNIFAANKLFSTLQINNLQSRSDLTDELFTLADNSASKDLTDDTLIAAYPFLESLNKGTGSLVYSYGEIERINKRMVAIATHLTDRLTTGDGSWSPNSREGMLTALADLESLQYSLKPVGNALRTSEAKSNSTKLSDSWSQAMTDCQKSTDDLIDSVFEAKPDMTAIQAAVIKLKGAISQLDKTNKGILDLP